MTVPPTPSWVCLWGTVGKQDVGTLAPSPREQAPSCLTLPCYPGLCVGGARVIPLGLVSEPDRPCPSSAP